MLNAFKCAADTKKIIDNIQILHECKDSRDDHFAKRKLKIRGLSSTNTADGQAMHRITDATGNEVDDEDDIELIQSLELSDMVKSKTVLREETTARNAVQSMIDAQIYIEDGDQSHSDIVLDIESTGLESSRDNEENENDTSQNWESVWRKFYEKQRDELCQASISKLWVSSFEKIALHPMA